METKVSDSGWLCIKGHDSKWVPVFKLSLKQLDEWKIVTNAQYILKTYIAEKK